jgi:hypothetical protein
MARSMHYGTRGFPYRSVFVFKLSDLQLNFIVAFIPVARYYTHSFVGQILQVLA